MMKQLCGATLTAAVLVFCATATRAQDTTHTGSADRMNSAGVPASDQHFMMKAAQGGMAEVQLGSLAKEHASSQAVKDFGQRMIDDHSKAGDELKALAAQKNVTLPSSLDAKDQAIIARLSKLNGSAFDRAYMRDMVADHKQDIAEFQRQAGTGQDPDVKNWAARTLPALQEHLKMAETALTSSR